MATKSVLTFLGMLSTLLAFAAARTLVFHKSDAVFLYGSTNVVVTSFFYD
ncbi:hypothetical protein HMPREF9003_0931 [Bifidobacterium dentium JCVIHMP022]|uniref:Uncharacterized protein n=1 Tax=Bifidobacterium dentium JCVIHMP022 TaxID=553191 RepID=A0AB72YY23_9BIFI|nr:hypothetical protein HMPREF9003_0931 [Bifidobacterium dentium JCVIHMP022]